MTSTPISTQDGVAGRSLPAVLLVVAACLLAWLETGSIDAADWLLYAIFAALLLALVFISGSAIAPSRLALVGLGALTGFAAWQAISAAWSPLPSLARDDALLTLFYVTALSIGLFTIRTRLDGVIATSAVAAGTGTLAVATGLAVRYGSDPGRYLVGDGRLAWPITYPNAAAAMFLVGLWPALLVAAQRRLPVLVRGLALGSAAAVLAAWLMTQSKGGGIALAVSAVVVLAVVPDRLRLLVPILIATALVGPQFGPLTASFNANAALAHVGRHAAFTLLWLTAAAVVAGVVYALVDRRVEVPARASRAAGVLALAVVVATVIAVPVAFFASVDHPGGYFGDRWRSFKHAPRDEYGRTHFISLGSNRYDFWRVALVEFRDHPLAGIGARGFGPAYLVERRSGETPVRAHSIELDALSELGIVGLVLLAAGLLPLPPALLPGPAPPEPGGDGGLCDRGLLARPRLGRLELDRSRRRSSLLPPPGRRGRLDGRADAAPPRMAARRSRRDRGRRARVRASVAVLPPLGPRARRLFVGRLGPALGPTPRPAHGPAVRDRGAHRVLSCRGDPAAAQGGSEGAARGRSSLRARPRLPGRQAARAKRGASCGRR